LERRSAEQVITGLGRPDRCPYHRVLSDEFHGCPAFLPAEFVSVDFQHRATRPVWTCHYLEVGTAEDGEYYPACALGCPEEREAWAARVQAERRELFRTMQVELGEMILPNVMELVEAKSRRLARGEQLQAGDDAEVGELVRLAMTQVDVVLGRRHRELRRLGVTPRLCRDLIEWILFQVGRGDDFSFPTLPAERLTGLPADVADLLSAFRG
jgi:hypothetical protein